MVHASWLGLLAAQNLRSSSHRRFGITAERLGIETSFTHNSLPTCHGDTPCSNNPFTIRPKLWGKVCLGAENRFFITSEWCERSSSLFEESNMTSREKSTPRGVVDTHGVDGCHEKILMTQAGEPSNAAVLSLPERALVALMLRLLLDSTTL